MSNELDLDLPAPFPPAGSYVNSVVVGSLLVLGGHIPIGVDGSVVLGKLGEELDTAAGYEAAGRAAYSALASMRAELGSLDRVRRIVMVRGWVNATPNFVEHTKVIDGASDVFIKVFGPAGQHARIAVGVNSLPANLALEIEVLAEIA
ncbi:RidA family protein [Fodinicola feengrottensis]|uniref:RidA family protein n=1 Tax=Fodinicola feengrottensis TaxID=435914 RepID=A0ABN2G0P4_9ACTN|nr:RidA family protein [Fodinicola feengrottensis]